MITHPSIIALFLHKVVRLRSAYDLVLTYITAVARRCFRLRTKNPHTINLCSPPHDLDVGL
eukprot:scaffold656125_cov65-Prasinocladus_malaysianus.AAC.1